MKSASSQLTKIADLGCNMFLCISFLSSSLYKLHSTRLAQVCSFQSTSPQAKIALWRGKSFFISMKCSFPSMVWISHEFSFAKMDNFMPVAKWSQACAFTQFCFLWNLLLNLALSLCYGFACVAAYFPGVSVLEDSEKISHFFYWEDKKTKR